MYEDEYGRCRCGIVVNIDRQPYIDNLVQNGVTNSNQFQNLIVRQPTLTLTGGGRWQPVRVGMILDGVWLRGRNIGSGQFISEYWCDDGEE